MAKKTPAQLVQERLALAAKAAREGNPQAAANFAQAAANIKGSGQAKVQAVANQYAAAAPNPVVNAPAPRPAPTPAPAAAPAAPAAAPSPIATAPGGREVTMDYARDIEQRVNDLLAQGNIEGARRQAQNITGGGPGVQNALGRINTAISAAESARGRVQDSQRQPEDDGTGTGAGASQDPRITELERQLAELLDRENAYEQDIKDRRENERKTAVAFMQDILTQYGMGDLSGDIDRLVRESGNNTSVLLNNIRQTQSYKDRFKGLLGLQQRGINDITNEAEYIGLESQYRQAFREAGIQNFLGDAGSRPERDAIARLVGDFSLSVNEVRDRISDAQRVVADTPQEVRESLQRFYNVDPATLTAYVLDPSRTSSEINRRANAAIVGGFAQRQGLQFGAGVSERIGSFFGGENDLQGTQVEPQLTTIAEAARGTRRLAQIEQSILSDEDVALSSLDLDATAKERVEGLKSRERARFGGSGAFTSTALTGVNKI